MPVVEILLYLAVVLYDQLDSYVTMARYAVRRYL